VIFSAFSARKYKSSPHRNQRNSVKHLTEKQARFFGKKLAAFERKSDVTKEKFAARMQQKISDNESRMKAMRYKNPQIQRRYTANVYGHKSINGPCKLIISQL
jgi:hypothetical protein